MAICGLERRERSGYARAPRGRAGPERRVMDSLETHKTALRGTPRERREYTEARRASAGSRDERRRRLARQARRRSSRLEIARDRGFLSVGPGELDGVEPVVADVRSLMDRLGPAPPSSGKNHLTTNLLPQESLSLDSSFLRLALADEVIAAVSAYLGVVPVLTTVDVWHSRPLGGDPRSSQLFHLDNADVSQVKLFVHCTDVVDSSGPLTVLDATRSRRLARQTRYRIGDGRVSDERVLEVLGDEAEPTRLTGPSGTAQFVDTSRCFHFGSRVQRDSPARTVAMLQYLTPYAFAFTRDHREEAPHRRLATADLPELQRLVLGAA
jgi:hypothetical protein